MDQNPKVIIITGSCGVGKTTIARLLSEKLNVEIISGDTIKQKRFPEIDYITNYPEKLKIVKEALFLSCKKNFKNGKTVIVDYVILGRDYIFKFKKEFEEDLILKVLLPPRNIIYLRDQIREYWTSGKEAIDETYESYKHLSDIIGTENFINNENESPEETARNILKLIT